MPQRLAHIAVTVRDYDEAITFYVDKLGFELVEDSPREGGKRWVIVRPPGADSRNPGASILLSRAVGDEQLATVGRQTGGRVFLFIETDEFWGDYHALRARGVECVREPSEQPYGTVAVLIDLYGNKIDLIGPNAAPPAQAPQP